MATSTMCLNPPTKLAYHLCKTCGKSVQLRFELSIVNFVAYKVGEVLEEFLNGTCCWANSCITKGLVR